MDQGRLGGLGKRLATMEAQQQRLGTTGNDADYYKFRMCATDPPSTRVHVRGGQMWDMGSGYARLTPSNTFDLEDYDTTRRRSQFTVPYAYTFYWLSVSMDGSRLYVGGGAFVEWWSEYETAIKAEEAAMADDCFQLHNYPPWDLGVPIGCLVLRNDGDISEPNHFLPIDRLNRGRSYIWRTHASLATRNVT